MTPTSEPATERAPHQHEPNIPPTADDPAECEACKLFDAQHAQIRDLTKQRDAWKDHKLPDDEAQAIAACVKALDAFTSTSRSSSTSWTQTDNGKVSRVLDYLAQRYGVVQEPKLQRLLDGLSERLSQPQQQPTVWQPVGTYGVPGTTFG